MPWPVPAPGVIAGRAAAQFEQQLPGIDARSDNTVATALTRITELAAQDLYFMQGYLAQQLMVNTATDWLPLHGAMWGVPQVQPAAAAGAIMVTGPGLAVIPAGVVFSSTAQGLYTSTAAVTLSAGGTGSLAVVADVAGSAGNLPPGSPMTVVSPVAGLAPQSGVVDVVGISGGLDIESLDSWRARIEAKIQIEPSGGSYADYEQWAKAALPNVEYASCPPAACGGGAVAVAFAMAGPSVPTVEEVAAVQAYIETLAPVTAQANVTVYPAVLVPVNISLQVRPNTVTIQAAAQQALALFFAQSAVIGGPLDRSNLDAAISGGDGESYHDLLAPTADIPAGGLFNLLTLGTVSFS